MPKIINLSMSDVTQGRFPEWANQNTVLIQIQDADFSPLNARFANVKKRSRFIKVYQLRFDDVETEEPKYHTAITDEQAQQLASILTTCLRNDVNVVVHCHAGLCRSGAVTEVGVQLGFEDPGVQRIPNLLVKRKILEVLGMAKSEDYYNGLWN